MHIKMSRQGPMMSRKLPYNQLIIFTSVHDKVNKVQ
jgi:hypothetical protein